jgi:transcriptional regulator with PAS, ATPase and Fis domain
MSTAKAAIVESINKGHLRGLPSHPRRAQPARRLEKIREMAAALLEETASLEHEEGMAEASATVTGLSATSEIDFFEEVRRFEIRLIERAMELAGGNQARAAKLLGLGTTTLNYKIKTYQLQQP